MTEYLIRRNPVLEALRGSRREIYTLWLQENLDRKLAAPLLAAAKARRVPVKQISKQKLGQMARDSSHQGVLLEVGPYVYADVAEMLALAEKQGERPFLLLLDLLHGPQNIGQLLRTAEIVGVHGVIMQDRRAPEITPAVTQFSAGAAEHLLIAQVTNLVQTIKQLQAEGVWVVGMDMGADVRKLGEVDLDMPLAIVVGHEGQGLRRLVRESCDFILELPMRGHVESLNAAVAGSVLLYAAWQARGFAGTAVP
ncbi:MAG: 23S rRNA (guanosine(2251)-2'-O)-methyltransferase RlmB [Ardenticatenaceae bacterium]|nr:23S rRNA (guanosine(2251)-2'-O)-methyltransferase RlmB [Ardenticatenaceae bacterium]MCB8990607.1 23S rRNA (guanosine(2251)-2'-O)-methyltransferase RlmB [Ardenticatenaceae bacterium]MCB9004314.1 23S rRNA (guanosine(2251)-2'-O)-methyltransferase RlmB [Ardenticatenaceae bacterium]